MSKILIKIEWLFVVIKTLPFATSFQRVEIVVRNQENRRHEYFLYIFRKLLIFIQWKLSYSIIMIIIRRRRNGIIIIYYRLNHNINIKCLINSIYSFITFWLVSSLLLTQENDKLLSSVQHPFNVKLQRSYVNFWATNLKERWVRMIKYWVSSTLNLMYRFERDTSSIVLHCFFPFSSPFQYLLPRNLNFFSC